MAAGRIRTYEETKEYLEVEINRSLRYSTTFSCLSISVSNISTGKEMRKPELHELEQIFLDISKLFKHTIRNFDFIGLLGTLEDNYLLVVMNMVGKKESMKVAMRLVEEVKALRINVNGRPETIELILSSLTFDPKINPDPSSFILLLRERHSKEIKLVSERMKINHTK